MKNLKKIVALLTVLALCVGMSLSLASCKKKHEHSWDAGAVTKEATCLEKGTKTFTCSCGETKTEDIPVGEHVYKWGKCFACGDTYVKDDKNFYFTLAESLLDVERFYVNLTDFTIDVKTYESNSSNPTHSLNFKVNLAHFMLSVDENGNPVGKGEGKLVGTAGGDASFADGADAMSAEAVVVLKDGGFYLLAKATIGDDTEQMEMYIDLANTVAEEEINQITAIIPMLEELYNEGLDDIIGDIKNYRNSPINAAVAMVTEYVFTKKATETGYVFTLNYDRITELYYAVMNKKINELVDMVLGNGVFADLENWARGLWNKDFATLEKELTDICADLGVDIKDVYAYVNVVVNAIQGDPSDPEYKEFDVEEFIAELREMKVSEFINGMAGDETVTEEQFNEALDEVFDLLKENTLGEMMGPTSKPEPDSPKDNFNDGINTASEVDTVREQLVEVVNMLKGVVVGFTTDKDGRFISFNVNVNLKDMVLAEQTQEDGSKVTAKLTATGALVVNTTGNITKNFDSVVNAIMNKVNKVEFEEGQELIVRSGYEYSDNYVIVNHEGKLYAVETYDENDYYYEWSSEETELDGVACTKYVVYEYARVILVDNLAGYMIYGGTDEIRYSLVSFYGNYYTTYYTVYRTAEGEILKVEFNSENTFTEENETASSYSLELVYVVSEDKFYAE